MDDVGEGWKIPTAMSSPVGDVVVRRGVKSPWTLIALGVRRAMGVGIAYRTDRSGTAICSSFPKDTRLDWRRSERDKGVFLADF